MLKYLKVSRSIPDPRSLESGKPIQSSEHYRMSFESGNGLSIEEFDTHFSLKSKTKTVCVPLSAAERQKTHAICTASLPALSIGSGASGIELLLPSNG